MHWKMAKSCANFAHNFNESSWYSTKVFLVLNIWFLQNFDSFHLINDQNLLLHSNIAGA